MPGDFYEISDTVDEHEITSTVPAAEMAPLSTAAMVIDNTESSESMQTAAEVYHSTESILHELHVYSNLMRGQLCTRSGNKLFKDKLCTDTKVVFHEAGLQSVNPEDTQQLTDLLSFSLIWDFLLDLTKNHPTSGTNVYCSVIHFYRT